MNKNLTGMGLLNTLVGNESEEIVTPKAGLEADLAFMDAMEDATVAMENHDVEIISADISVHNAESILLAKNASQVEIEAILGTEAGPVDVAKRGFYKVKTLIKQAVRAIINFFKKILSFGLVSEKTMKSMSKKAKAELKLFKKEVVKKKVDPEKERESKIKGLTKLIGTLKNRHGVLENCVDLCGDAVKSLKEIIEDLATLNKAQAGSLTGNNITGLTAKIVGKLEGVFTDASGKTLKDKMKTAGYEDGKITEMKSDIKDQIKDCDSESMKFQALSTAVISGLGTVESTANDLGSNKLTKTAKKVEKDLNKLSVDVNKDIYSNVNVNSFNQEKLTTALVGVQKGITNLSILPSGIALVLKAEFTVMSKILTESKATLSM